MLLNQARGILSLVLMQGVLEEPSGSDNMRALWGALHLLDEAAVMLVRAAEEEAGKEHQS